MKRLGIVADTYVDFSIKDSTRKSRGMETRLKDTQSSTVYTLFTGCDPTSSFYGDQTHSGSKNLCLTQNEKILLTLNY